jgi:predicted DNA-binding protein
MERKYKRGDVREDGMVFRNYTCRGTEWWVTPEGLAAMKERNKKERKAYCKRNPEKVSQSMKNWNLKNPGRNAAIAKEWRQKNKEYVNAVSRKWKKNNPEKVKEMIESRIQKDRDSYLAERRMARAKRRAILKERLHPEHNFEIEKVLTDQCKRLYKKFGVKFEVDHIVPLDKGGWHHHLNLQVIPMVWNRRKHTKDASVLPNCWINK